MIKGIFNPSPLTYLLELSFANAVSVKDDPVWLEPCTLVELYQHLPDHGCQFTDDLLAMGLDPHCGAVPTRVGIHTRNKLQVCVCVCVCVYTAYNICV